MNKHVKNIVNFVYCEFLNELKLTMQDKSQLACLSCQCTLACRVAEFNHGFDVKLSLLSRNCGGMRSLFVW